MAPPACPPALPARACDTALLLAIDVSGSIDAADYRLQAEGLAAALADPAVTEALVEGQVALAVLQWSGAGQQELSLSWQRMLAPADVARFANRAAAMPPAPRAKGRLAGSSSTGTLPISDNDFARF